MSILDRGGRWRHSRASWASFEFIANQKAKSSAEQRAQSSIAESWTISTGAAASTKHELWPSHARLSSAADGSDGFQRTSIHARCDGNATPSHDQSSLPAAADVPPTASGFQTATADDADCPAALKSTLHSSTPSTTVAIYTNHIRYVTDTSDLDGRWHADAAGYSKYIRANATIQTITAKCTVRSLIPHR